VAGLDEENVEELAQRLNSGDVSVLLYGVENPGTRMMTTKGSANDVFWSALEKVGLTESHPVPDDIGGELEAAGITLRFYTVTEQGEAEIPALLERTRK
jgi:hypothetical protein